MTVRSTAERAIVLAPHGRDAAIAAAMLGEADIATEVAADVPALVRDLRAGAGFAIVTEEALRTADLRDLDGFLREQEEWSDFPFVLLTRRGGGLERNPAAVRFLEMLGNVTFLERPFHPTTLVSLAKSALRARRRQYEARSRLEAINASEAKFRAFAQAVPNHLWTATPAGALDWFNDRVSEYSGKAVGALMGGGWRAIVHPDDRVGADARWVASVASGDTLQTEYRIRNANGEFRWHLVRALPIRDDEGAVLRWIGTNTDIHDQKLVEAETVRDRDRLWMLTRDIMIVVDLDGVTTAVNPSALSVLGWREDEMVGRSLFDFLHADDVARLLEEVASLAEGATTVAFEGRVRCRNGHYRLLDWSAVRDGERLHAVARDITDERLLARDRERIWNLSPVLKVVARPDGEIQDVNPSWSNVLGWRADETIGRNILDFVTPEARNESVASLAQLADGVMVEVERRYRTRDGDERRIAWITVPDGGTLYAFGRDITAEAEAAEALAATEDALRQSQKMEAVGQLTGGIAHDFNNLLQGITGSLEIVQRRIDAGRLDDVGRFIGGATTAANRAAALTHRLLAFSRRQPLDPKPVACNPLVASTEELLRRTIGERIALRLMLADDLWLTLCDHNQLENAILNLAINARDAMPEGGALTIETSNVTIDRSRAARDGELQAGAFVCVSVTDTGIGMDADTIAKAFEPFFTTKPIGQGTGLGLSMIYGFARQSEGFARIESAPHRGTTFSLFLPRYIGEAMHEAGEAVPRAQPTNAGESVLVVEDEAVVRQLIVEVLTELGYRAIEACDGPEGLERLRSGARIDLLITDIGLPGLNGRQVADAARVLRPELKILFMTGYAEAAAMAPGFLQRGMAMITKPFAMDVMAERIRTMIAGG